jgi:hypothetical protein
MLRGLIAALLSADRMSIELSPKQVSKKKGSKK